MRNYVIVFIILWISLLGYYYVLAKNQLVKQVVKSNPVNSEIIEVSPKDEFSFSNHDKDFKDVAFGDAEHIQGYNISSGANSLEKFDDNKPKDNSLGVFGERESLADPKRYSVGITYKIKLDP